MVNSLAYKKARGSLNVVGLGALVQPTDVRPPMTEPSETIPTTADHPLWSASP